MSDIKCPVCNVPLDECDDLLCCPNDHCAWVGNKELWQEFIRTRKALDVSIRGLDQMTWGCDSTDAELLLKEIKEITAPEQKD